MSRKDKGCEKRTLERGAEQASGQNEDIRPTRADNLRT